MRVTRSWRRPLLAAVGIVHVAAIPLALSGSARLAAALLVGSHLLVLWGTLRPGSRLLGPVIRRFRTSAREVWLTIDDGPSADTPAILDLLARHRARATFFLVGERAQRYPDHVRSILAAGHGIGNHTDLHPSASFWRLGPRALDAEIGDAQRRLSTIAGQTPRLFRPAVGMANVFVAPTLARLGLLHVGWSARGFDAVIDDPRRVCNRVLRGLRPGAIVLLHEGAAHGRSPEVIATVLESLDGLGYRCVLPPLPGPATSTSTA